MKLSPLQRSAAEYALENPKSWDGKAVTMVITVALSDKAMEAYKEAEEESERLEAEAFEEAQEAVNHRKLMLEKREAANAKGKAKKA